MVEHEGESRGNQLLRHFQGLVAWPGAVNRLLDNEFRMLLNDNLSVGLVKVQPCNSLLYSMEEMMNEYVRSFSPNEYVRSFSPNDDFGCGSDIFHFGMLFRSPKWAVRMHQAPEIQTRTMTTLACVINSRTPSINIAHGRLAGLFMPRQR